jgi:hypothetical protein
MGFRFLLVILMDTKIQIAHLQVTTMQCSNNSVAAILSRKSSYRCTVPGASDEDPDPV